MRYLNYSHSAILFSFCNNQDHTIMWENLRGIGSSARVLRARFAQHELCFVAHDVHPGMTSSVNGLRRSLCGVCRVFCDSRCVLCGR